MCKCPVPIGFKPASRNGKLKLIARTEAPYWFILVHKILNVQWAKVVDGFKSEDQNLEYNPKFHR